MAASYPSSTKTFSTKAGGGTIESEHVNALQDEVASVETGLLSGLAHVLKPLTNAAYDLGTTLLKWKDLFLSGNLSVGGTSTLTGVISSSGQPRCRATHSTTQSVANVNWATVSLDSEDFDTGSMHAADHYVTIPAGGDGLYWIHGKVTFATNAAGSRTVGLVLFSSGASLLQVNQAAVADTDTVVQVSLLRQCVAGEAFYLQVYQSSGGALNIGNAAAGLKNALEIVKLW
jgi:hypothetical protein